MGAKQSSNSNTSPSPLIQSNGSNVSANGHHSHHNNNGLIGVMPSTSMSTNGSSRTNSTRLNTNTDINTNDWRQRTRSLSSVLSGQQTNGSAIHVSQLNSFGLSASPDSDTSTEDNLPFGRVFSAHSLPVQLISFNGRNCFIL
jgi:hypothetical protein